MEGAKTGMVYESSTADFSCLVHHARRDDGQWFTRYQQRDPRFGYRWGSWRKASAPAYARETGRKARLPKDSPEPGCLDCSRGFEDCACSVEGRR